MLNLCYLEPNSFDQAGEQFQDYVIRISPFQVKGDVQVRNVLDCLIDIACMYGYHVILLQYLPYAWDVVSSARKRITPNLEAGLIGVLNLLYAVLPYLSDSLMMKVLPDDILANLLFPILQILTSRSMVFSRGWKLRKNLVYKFLDATYLIGMRIGEEMSRSHLTPLCSAFFSSFDKVYDRDGRKLEIEEESAESKKVSTELEKVLSPETAYAAYIAFYTLFGRTHLDESIVNLGVIKTLCLYQQKSGDPPIFRPATFTCLRGLPENSLSSPLSSGGGNKVDVTGGNSLVPQQSSEDDSQYSNDLHVLIAKDINASPKRHLKGNWLAYWEHEIGRSEKDAKFTLKQIKLQSFVGHNAAVKSIQVLDNENSFLSGSRDRTVKVWSLRNTGEGDANVSCQWTYGLHKKSVFFVSFLESQRLSVSCDANVHIWDPFVGSGVHQVDSQRLGPIHSVVTLCPPSPLLAGATHDSMLHLIDCRLGNVVTDIKVSVGSTGLVKTLNRTQDGNSLIVGHSSGYISLLDLRIGKIFQSWKAHEGEVLSLSVLGDEDEFLSTSLDQTVSVWCSIDGKLRSHLAGAQEPIHCVSLFPPSSADKAMTIVSGTTANRVGIRYGARADSSYHSTKLRSDIVKSNLTSLKGLPMNHLLLVGQDNGSITLLN